MKKLGFQQPSFKSVLMASASFLPFWWCKLHDEAKSKNNAQEKSDQIAVHY